MWAAADNKNGEVIAILIKAGADVNAQDSDSQTALMFAAESNTNTEVSTALLNAGSKIEAQDSLGRTPLMRAAAKNPNPPRQAIPHHRQHR
jgi:ankyrin repeat protein